MSAESQDSLFARARQAFQDRGLLGRALRIEWQGRLYSVRCDEACFSLYRVNEKSYLPPGLPGWMVCRLWASGCFSLDQGEASCGLPHTPEQAEQAAAWLEMAISRLPEDAS